MAKCHTSRLLSLAKTYGFWNYTSQENREDLLRYLEALFYLIFKPRSQALLSKPEMVGLLGLTDNSLHHQ